ncbi:MULTISPECIES: class I SAM-dependent methyltransferase [Paenibacillus]|uniref:class I SAM-dependent methyltransferase n=1 Tax=Paenibacillus TaxID=44249 RepID=UPI001F0D8D7D|nr:class I SAM-dependent methyltransferase [Paenibacillus macerans]MEC0330845.1 class I SAM-dependent methyltransferase [Paenibacillus macerans]UMV48128.1 class I SAM-dependent methyltransferase [Paenibacillus macerans]
MAKLNLDYYKSSNDDLYSDGDIEQELFKISQSMDEYDWYQDGRWPIVYHFSHLRHNILNWFPFKQNCSILEIGAGCGAITGLFCERAEKVVAVELTKRRAEINYQRHKHYENLEIVVGDIQSIPSDWKFDYVIVNGVLEYAAYMIDSENPYKKFLEISSSHLNEKGRILVSIENRLGLKYFSGAKEDHTGEYFSGINGYMHGEKVRTFSKVELCELVEQASLHVLKYYYPYPDYKFPAEIFTDKTINTIVPSVPNYPMDMSRAALFEEQKIYQSFMKQKIMDNFANSFLVEIASVPNEKAANISYAKLSANRKEQFRICTIFDDAMNCVYKKALNSKALMHLSNMERYSGFQYSYDGSMENIACKKETTGLSYSFLSQVSLEELLIEALRNDQNLFYKEISRFRDTLFNNVPKEHQPHSSEFKEIFGDLRCQQELHWASDRNLDMISGNVFVNENSYRVIDYEWHFRCELPLEFVIWRMLRQFMTDHSLDSLLTPSIINDLIHIDQQTEECFISWETHFAREYVGIKELYSLSKDIIPLNIERAVTQYLKENRLKTTLFFDVGKGYTDVNIESKYAVPVSGYFRVTFQKDTLKKAKLLRWDPLEGEASWVKIKSIETDGIVSDINPINAEENSEDKGAKFFTFDPQFEIFGDFTNATYLTIDFFCSIIDWTEGYLEREIEINQLRELVADIQNKIITIQQNYEKTENQLVFTTNELKSTQAHLDEALSAQKSTQAKLEIVEHELENTQKYLSHITKFAREHKFKAVKNVLFHGEITRGTLDE